MIDSLYTKYFQKSRSFLYPILGIVRSQPFSPSGTYIALDNVIGPEDMKLIVTFKQENSPEYKEFEEQMLLSNPLFFSVMHIDNYSVYVFDYSTYEKDWFNFILGKYSQFSSVLKKAVKVYYGDQSSEYQYMDSFLNPDKYYEVYAKILDIDMQVLKQVKELCDPCDMEKETLKIPVEHLENLKKVL
jgi:hypothetical protein